MTPDFRSAHGEQMSATAFWSCALLCSAVITLSLLIAAPWGDFAFNDDWAVAAVARQVAKTGGLHYSGWLEPTVGAQAYWGALFIRLFGPSYEVLRLSTVPLAWGCAAVLLWFARSLGLSAPLAVLGCLAVLGSPLLLPYEVSFMTEIPSLLFLLLALAAGYRALEQPAALQARRWIVLLVASSLVGGSIRQIGFLPALLVLPFVAFSGRDSKPVRWAAACGWAITLLSAIALNAWFSRQPHAVVLPLSQLARHMRFHGRFVLSMMWATPFLLFWFVLPVTAALWNRLGSKRIAVGVASAALSTALCFLVGFWLGRHWTIVPWGNTVDIYGLLGLSSFVGQRAYPLRRLVYLVVTLMANFGVAVIARPMLGDLRSALTSVLAPRSQGRALLLTTVPFAVSYLALTYVHASVMNFFDRYLIPILPLAVLGLLYWLSRYQRLMAPFITSWIVTGLFLSYAVASTHDYYARRRAIAAVARDLQEGEGIPLDRIAGGFEQQAEAQMAIDGVLRNISFDLATGSIPLPPQHYWFDIYTPALHPEFYLALGPVPGLIDSGLAPYRFHLWLPPYESEVRVLKPPASQLPRQAAAVSRALDNHGQLR